MDRPGTCIIILDKKYNLANSSCHFGSYGSIWTGTSPKNIIWTSEASVNIIFFWWRTGPYTAIWPSVPWTICYLSNFLFWRKQNVYTNQRLRWSSLISIHPKKIQYLYRVPRGRCVTWHEVSIEGQTVKKLISRKDPLSIMSLRKLVIIKCSCLFL
jgi:hypothetical protein